MIVIAYHLKKKIWMKFWRKLIQIVKNTSKQNLQKPFKKYKYCFLAKICFSNFMKYDRKIIDVGIPTIDVDFMIVVAKIIVNCLEKAVKLKGLWMKKEMFN